MHGPSNRSDLTAAIRALIAGSPRRAGGGKSKLARDGQRTPRLLARLRGEFTQRDLARSDPRSRDVARGRATR
jgi:hypothetical protein